MTGATPGRAWRLGVLGPGGRKFGGEGVRTAPLKASWVGRAGPRAGEAKGPSGAGGAPGAGAAPAAPGAGALRLVLERASFSFLVRHLRVAG